MIPMLELLGVVMRFETDRPLTAPHPDFILVAIPHVNNPTQSSMMRVAWHPTEDQWRAAINDLVEYRRRCMIPEA